MSLRIRLFLLLIASYCVGGYFLTRWALDQVRPRYLESMEETLVDTSVLLASVLETQLTTDRLDAGELQRIFTAARQRAFQAQVFSLNKTAVDMRVYVTDASGIVLLDSTGRDIGRDYSKWNDVNRTLRGQYGARSTHDEAGNDATQVIYVAAPIRHDGRIIGVLSIGKPTRGINQLVTAAKQKLLLGAALGGMAVLVLLLTAAAWVIAPLERLTVYARAIRDGRPAKLSTLPGRTLRDLGAAFEEMRDALEGRQYVERYTQTLAHEVKAPLAAIRGAAELLDEEMPVEQRKKFITNIRTETARIQQIIERLLELSSLEARKTLRKIERIEARVLLEEAAAALRPAFDPARVTLSVEGDADIRLRGERELLRAALVNLLQNALDFTPAGGRVRLYAKADGSRVAFCVEDTGLGVPDYALERVFDRFYSLPRPGSGRKSTGIGLSLVREIAHLHGGDALLANRPQGGVSVTLWVSAEHRVV